MVGPGTSKWRPQYVLTDDSAIEQAAVRKAFPGLEAGEQEVSHLLYTVHSHRTLQRRLGSEALKPVFNTLRHAMYVYTGVKCQELCEEAIRLAPDNKTKGYIRSYWLETSSKWALYARQHSPMLLQNTTTNACESWHRQLKASLGVDKGKVTNYGMLNLYNSKLLLHWPEY